MYKYIVLLLVIGASTAEAIFDHCVNCKESTNYLRYFTEEGKKSKIENMCFATSLGRQDLCRELVPLLEFAVNEPNFCYMKGYCEWHERYSSKIKEKRRMCFFDTKSECDSFAEKLRSNIPNAKSILVDACASLSETDSQFDCVQVVDSNLEQAKKLLEIYLNPTELCSNTICEKASSGSPRGGLSSLAPRQGRTKSESDKVASFLKMMQVLWNTFMMENNNVAPEDPFWPDFVMGPDAPDLLASRSGEFSSRLSVASLIPKCMRCQALFYFARNTLREKSNVQMIKEFIMTKICPRILFKRACSTFVDHNLEMYLEETFLQQEPLATCVDLGACNRTKIGLLY